MEIDVSLKPALALLGCVGNEASGIGRRAAQQDEEKRSSHSSSYLAGTFQKASEGIRRPQKSPRYGLMPWQVSSTLSPRFLTVLDGVDATPADEGLEAWRLGDTPFLPLLSQC